MKVAPAPGLSPAHSRAVEAGTLFQRCSAVFGEVHDLAEQPRVAEYAGVLLSGTVLYDGRRQLVTDAAFFRGVPHMRTEDARDTSRVPARAAERLPPGRYFWLGPVNLHFGHFIVSALSRLWALAGTDVRAWTLLYVDGAPPEELFRIGFVRDCLSALGIVPAQLRQVAGPLFIPAITVAEPGLVENFGASRAYTDMLGRIRQVLLPGLDPGAAAPGPVYITKQHVPHGIRSIANEDEVTALLAQRGVTVASPETLSFRDQLAFWCGHRAFAGFAGSAFHLAAFAGGRQLCTVSHDHLASANQVLLDRLAGNRHLYLHAGPGMVGLGASNRFTDVVRIVDTAAYARGMLQLLDGLGDLSGQELGPEPRSVWPDALTLEPFGTELARAGRASQSSDYEFDEGRNRTAEGALSGRLTGSYQCSTRREDQPWWQVELAEPARIFEVRIYNRCDNALVRDRLAGFRLGTSSNGVDWSVVHVHEGPAPGPDPFRWQAYATTVARFVRLTLPGDTYLHLDQVEVFGEAPA